MKRALSIALVIVGVVALGAVLAVGAGLVYLWIHRPTPEQQKLVESGKQSQVVFSQYQTGDYATAKKALLENASRLDGLSAESGNSNRNPYAVDAMMSYVRLAKLEEKNKGTAQAEYMKEASARCGRLGWADCSEKRLRRDIDRMDEIGARVASQ